MNANVQRYARDLVARQGWTPGSSLENRFALRLHRIGIHPGHLIPQHPVGRYRLDFADPDVFMGIEADGFYHRMPGAAERDQQRDQELLEQGWFLFRICDESDEGDLEERLLAAILLIREERIYQQMPWKREPAIRGKGKPSRLARAAGYRPPRAA